ncbi:MAG TPA: site-2 protease family protein [bacterium]|nr:site-2 protease family protein [bacterium]
MLTGRFSDPLSIVLLLAAVTVATTCHEFAHAFVADRLGDPTARQLGRLSLNPLVHADILGTLCFVLFGFGWAKPVPVNPRNFANPRQGMLQVAIAGPLANLTVAAIVGVLARTFVPPTASLVLELLAIIAWINVILAVFNMIPVPPLDGSRVVEAVLPLQQAYAYARLQPYGMLVLFVLLYLGVVGRVLLPVAGWLYGVTTGGLGGP